MPEPRSRKTSSTHNLRRAEPGPPSSGGPATLERPRDDPPTLGFGGERFVDDYEILEELGHGGMGVVYKARHRELGRVVALKMVLRARFARAEELMRFRFEGEAVAALSHPNIVQLHEVGTCEGQPYLVLEYVEGGTLSERLRRGRPSAAEAAGLVETLARAVQFAHERGIVHRDLKPGNVLLSDRTYTSDTTYESLKVTDFGLAKRAENAGLTETGRVLGTPGYMAPEQAGGRSREVGPHTDTYALGAILYECLTGRTPFVASDSADTIIQVLTREPTPPHALDAAVPRDLETIALKCLEKEPAKRYGSARDLADDLARYRDGRPIRARPVGPAERAWKWARRRPVVAALAASLLLVSALGFAGVSAALLYAVEGRREARDQRDLAEGEREKAERQRDRAEAGAAFNRLARAQLEWRMNNLAGSANLLRQIDAGRRGWEWHHLRGLHHGELRSLSRPNIVSAPGLSFRPDGAHLAVAWGNPYDTRGRGEVAVFDVRTGALVRALTGFRAMAFQVAYSPDGKRLAACGDDETVRVWDAETGELLRAFEGRLGAMYDLTWSRDGRRVFASCIKAGVRGWDVETGKAVGSLIDSKHWAHCVAISPDGRYLAGSSGGTRVWDLTTGAELFQIGRDSQRVAFSPDGQTLACVNSGLVRLHSARDGRELRSLAGHDGDVLSAAFSPCGLFLVTGGADSTVRLWDALEGHELSVWRGHEGRVESVAFHPGGALVASGGAQPGDVKLWDVTRVQQYERVFDPMSQVWVSALAFSEAGDVLALRKGGELEGRDPRSGAVRFRRELPLSSAWRTPGALAAFSGDGRVLAGLTSHGDQRVRAWRVGGGPLAGSYLHSVPVWHVAADASRLVASAGIGARRNEPYTEVAVWEPATGRVVMELEETYLMTTCLALSPDGRRLARGVSVVGARLGFDGKLLGTPTSSRVEVWDVRADAVASGPILTLDIGDQTARGVAFSPDGALLACADEGGRVHAWDTAGRRLGEPLMGPVGVEGLAFRPDGRLLAGVSRAEVTIWDLREGLEVLRLRGAPPRHRDGGFSPRVAWDRDGRRLAASCWDHSVAVWDSADLASDGAKAELARAAAERLPRWHLRNAADALKGGRTEALRFHLGRAERMEVLCQADLLLRGDLHGRLGDWDKARRDYAAAVEAGPLPAMAGRRLVTLWAWKGDRVECVRHAAALLDGGALEATTYPVVAAALAGALFDGLTPEPRRLCDALERLSDDDFVWCRIAWSLAALRAGRLDEARTTAERALARADDAGEAARASASFALSLAHVRAGRADEARPWLAKGRAQLAALRKDAADEGRALSRWADWCDWLTALMLEREAASLLGEAG